MSETVLCGVSVRCMSGMGTLLRRLLQLEPMAWKHLFIPKTSPDMLSQ